MLRIYVTERVGRRDSSSEIPPQGWAPARDPRTADLVVTHPDIHRTDHAAMYRRLLVIVEEAGEVTGHEIRRGKAKMHKWGPSSSLTELLNDWTIGQADNASGLDEGSDPSYIESHNELRGAVERAAQSVSELVATYDRYEDQLHRFIRTRVGKDAQIQIVDLARDLDELRALTAGLSSLAADSRTGTPRSWERVLAWVAIGSLVISGMAEVREWVLQDDGAPDSASQLVIKCDEAIDRLEEVSRLDP